MGDLVVLMYGFTVRLSDVTFQKCRHISSVLITHFTFQSETVLCRYNFILFPVKGAVCKALPKSRRSTSEVHLSYCDLEKLPQEILLNICDWLHTGVGVLSRTNGVRLFQNGPMHEGEHIQVCAVRTLTLLYITSNCRLPEPLTQYHP